MIEELQKTDEEVAKLVQQGETDKFEILLERYEEKIKRYSQKFLSEKVDIEDAVQNIFLKAFENIQSFNPKRKFSTWLFAIAHNELVNFLKKKKKMPLSLIELDTFLPISLRDDSLRENFNFDFEKERQALEKALDELELKYKEPIFLFYFENLSYQEISEILKIPISTVGVRIKRAKEKIKKALEDLKNKKS